MISCADNGLTVELKKFLFHMMCEFTRCELTDKIPNQSTTQNSCNVHQYALWPGEMRTDSGSWWRCPWYTSTWNISLAKLRALTLNIITALIEWSSGNQWLDVDGVFRWCCPTVFMRSEQSFLCQSQPAGCYSSSATFRSRDSNTNMVSWMWLFNTLSLLFHSSPRTALF